MEINLNIITDRLTFFEELLEKPAPEELNEMQKYLDQVSQYNSENSKLLCNLNDLMIDITALKDPELNKDKIKVKKLLFRCKELKTSFSSRKSTMITVVSTEKTILFAEMNNRNNE